MESRLPGAHRLEVLDIAENVNLATADEMLPGGKPFDFEALTRRVRGMVG